MHPRYALGVALHPPRNQTSHLRGACYPTHDMELSLSSHGEKGLPVDQQHKEKKDMRRGDKSSRSMVKESMAVAVDPVKISSKENKRMEKRAGPIQE